jgi:hypothetical protein
MAERGEDVADAGLTFTANVDMFGTSVAVPLVENGENVDVTGGNVARFVREYVDFLTNRSVALQFSKFREGFQKLFSRDYLRHFTPDELDILVSGEQVLDWNNLEPHAKYIGGYRTASPQVKWFWEVFGDLPSEQKAKFLQFTTGSDRAPLGGLSNVVITIQKWSEPESLPISHTCFSTFCLPPYQTKDELRRKLLMALNETEGFGLR